MPRFIKYFVVVMLLSGAAYAQTGPTEQDYKNLDELKTKLVRMKKEMDKFMKDIIATYPNQSAGALDSFGQDIKVDVIENDKDITVRADLPGMDKDKISIVLENKRMLKITGSRDVVKKETSPGIVRQERMQGSFERILELPVDCKNDGIKATYKNGVLEIVIPKQEKAKEESVKINIQ